MDFYYLLQCSFTSRGEYRALKEVYKLFRYNYPTHIRARHQVPLQAQPNHKCWQPQCWHYWQWKTYGWATFTGM